MKGITCENGMQLAHEIYDSLKTVHKKYTLRPFNRFNVTKSMWWIIPSIEFPAYKFGKYMVEENSDHTFSVGIHIEKGLKQSVDMKEKLMLGDDWIWHDFVKAVEQGEVSQLLIDIAKQSKIPLNIEVKIDIPDIDMSGKITLKGQEFIDVRTEKVIEFENIPKKIREIEGIDWYWTDFFVYFVIPKVNQQTEADWTGFDIVNNLLAPFEQWIK